MQKLKLIGMISATVIKTLGESGRHYSSGDRIYLGNRNIKHIKRNHLSVYMKYRNRLPQIISKPDFVGINEDDGSLEYVKMFDDHVKLAVRIAGDERLYIRTMYIVYKSRTEHFVKSGKLKPLTKDN